MVHALSGKPDGQLAPAESRVAEATQSAEVFRQSDETAAVVR